MKRSPALVPLSHDHHRALVEARRLRRAADEPEEAPTAASSFLRFFQDETIPHFREEEEMVFPLVVSFDAARGLLTEAGNGPPEHVNDERDVLIVVLDGSVIVSVDRARHELGRGETAIISKGQRRRITAGRDGVRYLSVHRHRPPLMPR